MVQQLIPQLQTFDANGYLNAFRQGEQDGVQRQQRENRTRIGQITRDQGFLAGSQAALEAGDMDWATRLSQMDETQQRRMYDTLGRLASSADTPERWNTLVSTMRARFGAGAVQGFEDFGSREQAIRISMTASENLAEQHRRRQFAEQQRLHNAQIAHMGAQDQHLATIGAVQADTMELRRRQMDAQNLSRDRGFTLQSLQALGRARTPQEFQLVAETLRPMLGRVPTFQERDRIISAAMDSLEEFDLVPDEQGRPQRISRGWSPLVLAAIGPQGVGQGQGAGPPAPAPRPAQPVGQPNAITQAIDAITPDVVASNRRLGLPGVHRPDIAANPVLGALSGSQLNSVLPGAVPQAAPPQDQNPVMPAAQPRRAIVQGPQDVGAPIGGAPQPQGGGLVQPAAAPGGMVPPVIGGPQGGTVQAQAPAPAGPRPRGGVAAGRQAMVDEIEQQFGAPSTWGQNGNQAPPFSVIQRYWQSVHGGRAMQGMQYNAQGGLEPISGAPPRGGRGGGGGGGSNASTNALEVLNTTVPQIENAAEYMLRSDFVNNAASQIPGASFVGLTGFNNARTTLEFGTGTIMHSLSGATTTQREFERYAQAFLPNWNDVSDVRQYKLNSLMLVMRAIQAKARGGSINDADMAPIRQQMLDMQRSLLGLQPQQGSHPAGNPATTSGARRPSGWGGAGSMSTQEIINQYGRR